MKKVTRLQAGRALLVKMLITLEPRYGRVTIRVKNRVVGQPVQQNVFYIKMFGIICII